MTLAHVAAQPDRTAALHAQCHAITCEMPQLERRLHVLVQVPGSSRRQVDATTAFED
jgi:hypothetical protein